MDGQDQQAGWIGRAMTRREDPALLRGEGRFTADLVPEGALWVELLRSPVAAGTIVALEVEEAAAMPDVMAVLTADSLGDPGGNAVNALLPGAPELPFRVLARGSVAAVGQPVAAVIARSRDAARDAAEMLVLEIDETPAPAPAAVPVADWQGGVMEHGTVEVRAELRHARVAPMALEPRACLAIPEGGGLRVVLSTQTPHRCRDDLCRILGLDPERLRVVAPDVGGAFGGKASLYPEDALVAWAALRLGAPVAWVASRSEEFLAATQGRGAHSEGRLTLRGDGTGATLEARLEFPLGHWTPYSAYAPARNAGRILPGPYAMQGARVAVSVTPSAHAAVNIYRGAGRPEAAMLIERLVDKAARHLGVDPLTLRRLMVRPMQAPGAGLTGTWMDATDAAGLLDRLEHLSDYVALRAAQAERRARGEVLGLGVALYVEPCGQGWETARIELTQEGRFRLATGSTAQGQGRQTAWAQIAADALGVSPGLVDVVAGDTADLEDGIGALASRSTAIGGTAVLRCAEALMARLRAGMQAATGASAIADVTGMHAGRHHDWSEVAALLPDESRSASHRHEAEAEAWASGAVLAQVVIDRDTGKPCIERLIWVDDAGRVVNPLLVEGQMWGGLAQGLGCVMSEAVAYDPDGQLLTGSLMDYAVPRAGDMPLSVTLDKRPLASAANPLGVKGVGEAGCIGVPPAVLNALQDALSPFTETDLPLPATPLVLWQAMHMPEEL